LAEISLHSEFTAEGARGRPLCVDLDGTLVTTDTLWESVVLLIRERPWVIFSTPLWLLGGRARFKRHVTGKTRLNAATLPYRSDLVAALRLGREAGRTIVLATAADRQIAEDVASHLGLFDAVHASDGELNLKADNKRDLLQSKYGEAGFDYVGDSSADESILRVATRGYLVGATSGAVRSAERLPEVLLISRRPSLVRALIKELRPHQWAKNALVLLPLLLTPSALTLPLLFRGILAAAAFSICASAGYVFNDLLDLEADRAHATKVRRPFASGALPVILGPPLFFVLLCVGFGIAIAWLPRGFLVMLALYFVGTLSYSLFLKRVLLLDVLVLASLYAHRVLSGGVATGIHVSAWLLGFSMFFFTSLAFAKRYVELKALTGDDKVKNRGYLRTDLQMVTSMGTASGYIAALVFVLYVDSSAVRATYREPAFLWLALPVLLYWLGRIWLLAGRDQMQDDPVRFAVKDRLSLLCGVIIAAIVAFARFAPSWAQNLVH
jgi:4-hydroxybenzoate polyprenyltransferase